MSQILQLLQAANQNEPETWEVDPSDLNGGIHRCEDKKQAQKQQNQQQEPNKLELKNLLEAQTLLHNKIATIDRN